MEIFWCSNRKYVYCIPLDVQIYQHSYIKELIVSANIILSGTHRIIYSNVRFIVLTEILINDIWHCVKRVLLLRILENTVPSNVKKDMNLTKAKLNAFASLIFVIETNSPKKNIVDKFYCLIYVDNESFDRHKLYSAPFIIDIKLC